MMETGLHVRPYAFQVGGHSHDAEGGSSPASLVDAAGRFLKKLQAGERGEREARFMAAIQQHRAAGTAADVAMDCSACPSQAQHQLMRRLARWVPDSYGVVSLQGGQYLVMDDATAGYAQPCVLDIKVGYRTWYPWAADSLIQKYRAKDEGTTQGSCGFRLCGVLVHGAAGVWREDRHWGKRLTPDTLRQALTRFADNGRGLTLRQLALGPGGLLEQLRALATVFEAQACWHFFSASLLVVYEGAARGASEARPTVTLIDFAHTFACAGATNAEGSDADACASPEPRPSGRDENFLAGLRSLMSMLQQVAAEVGSGGAS